MNYRIDFSIHKGLKSGMVVGLSAGDDGPEASAAISLDDRAFFAIEPFLVRELGPEVIYSHFGPCKIPASVWRAVLPNLTTFSRDVSKAKSIEDVHQRPALSPELMVELTCNFEDVGPKVSRMLDEFVDIVRAWTVKYRYIYFFGV